MNRREAIRKRCLDCSGFSAKEVSECSHDWCELYSFRLPRKKQNSKEREKAIRKYCKNTCMAGSIEEVRQCSNTKCPLHEFRLQTESEKNSSTPPQNSPAFSKSADIGGGFQSM